MKSKPEVSKMQQAVHRMLKDDKKYKEDFVKEMTEEEYRCFLEECPEFLEDE